jgi:hypothetical protein
MILYEKEKIKEIKMGAPNFVVARKIGPSSTPDFILEGVTGFAV